MKKNTVDDDGYDNDVHDNDEGGDNINSGEAKVEQKRITKRRKEISLLNTPGFLGQQLLWIQTIFLQISRQIDCQHYFTVMLPHVAWASEKQGASVSSVSI